MIFDDFIVQYFLNNNNNNNWSFKNHDKKKIKNKHKQNYEIDDVFFIILLFLEYELYMIII